MKKISPILSALIITAVVGLGILVIGVNALTNPNATALQNSPATGQLANNASADAQVQQLTFQVNELQSQLQQADVAIQQYQNILIALQQRGVINIGQDGRITLPQGN